jgi:dTDP-glucose 4,6-dehydratase
LLLKSQAASVTRLLVTGGLGFIGSNYVLSAVRSGNFSKIVNVDSISYGANPKNLSELGGKSEYVFVKGSITDSEKVASLVSEADLVVHFAAETHVDRSIANPRAFLESNVVGTFNLLEAARRSKLAKFVHVSTDEVFGSASAGTSFHEDARTNPSSPYAASKAAGEAFVTAYHKTYGLPTAIVRCTNNFGPRQFPEKFIPKTIINALRGGMVPVYGDGSQVRDWIYVADFCGAIGLVLNNGRNGATYNVSSGNETSNLEVAETILATIGKPKEQIQFVEDRPGHDFRYSLDSSRIREELHWKPEYTFSRALKETVSWYVENKAWWEPLLNDKLLSPTPWKERWG